MIRAAGVAAAWPAYTHALGDLKAQAADRLDKILEFGEAPRRRH
jgi:hypothetical protein